MMTVLTVSQSHLPHMAMLGSVAPLWRPSQTLLVPIDLGCSYATAPTEGREVSGQGLASPDSQDWLHGELLLFTKPVPCARLC